MKWLTIVFFAFIMLVIVLANADQLRFLGVVYHFPNGDKAGHFILFGILTFLLDLTFFQALPHADRKRVSVIIGLILALLIALEEFSQKFIPARTFSLFDLFASYVGVIFFSWLALKITIPKGLKDL
ncbi:MAG: VanZ family protein [Anaerolineales bacterium]|nr:VanZ family protein [Anaerolineales bacterium]